MIKNKFKKHQEKWGRMSKLWNKFSKPGRPSEDDIRNYDQLLRTALKNKISPKVVVLGATPEIRILLDKYSKRQSAEIYCVDMTKDMYQAMSALIKNKNPKENFISSNWIEISKKIKPKSIDVVIGDYVIGNVGGSEDKFLKEVSKILKKDGCFITRAQIMDGIKNKFNIIKELQRNSQQAKKGQILIKEASSYFANNLILYTWYLNKENKISLSFIADEKFKELDDKVRAKGNSIEKRVLNKFHQSWFLMKDKYWINYKRSKLESILKNNFKIQEMLLSHDYEIAPQSPVYLLRNK